MSDEWKQHARITGFQKRIAELERENVELRAKADKFDAWEYNILQDLNDLAIECNNMRGLMPQLARLQAVARAANRVSSSDGLDLTIWGCAYSANGTDMCGTKRNPGLLCGFCELKAKTEGLERDDLKEVE